MPSWEYGPLFSQEHCLPSLQNILNNIYNSITSGLQPNNFGWTGYLWR